ncbi:hypothetical protein BESB_019240 [Besnoitia besnoiti]|uniref:Uncharacterized protein n=1 Tax=Besnoitia besnoiti TaxID=94643 RepID=A0A2A9M8G9_BESBE|nr:hypothetical protein BESB_019240 [Besnoitia besnoiti]PFH31983.1 hypothetical protein BESB_019240 [Besnoitia besnoiti]
MEDDEPEALSPRGSDDGDHLFDFASPRSRDVFRASLSLSMPCGDSESNPSSASSSLSAATSCCSLACTPTAAAASLPASSPAAAFALSPASSSSASSSSAAYLSSSAASSSSSAASRSPRASPPLQTDAAERDEGARASEDASSGVPQRGGTCEKFDRPSSGSCAQPDRCVLEVAGKNAACFSPRHPFPDHDCASTGSQTPPESDVSSSAASSSSSSSVAPSSPPVSTSRVGPGATSSPSSLVLVAGPVESCEAFSPRLPSDAEDPGAGGGGRAGSPDSFFSRRAGRARGGGFDSRLSSSAAASVASERRAASAELDVVARSVSFPPHSSHHPPSLSCGSSPAAPSSPSVGAAAAAGLLAASLPVSALPRSSFFSFGEQSGEKAADSQFLSSAGSLLWTFGKKISSSGKAAAEAAAHAATRAALVTVGEPTIIPASPSSAVDHAEMRSDPRREEANFAPSEPDESEAGGPRCARGDLRAEAGSEEEPISANQDAADKAKELQMAEEGKAATRLYEAEGSEEEDQTNASPRVAPNCERKREPRSEEELRQEIEALRQQVRTYHEVLAQMSFHPPSSRKDGADALPAQEARSASVRDLDGNAGDSAEDAEDRGEEATKALELQKELIEALCSAAADAAAAAALTATKAAFRAAPQRLFTPDSSPVCSRGASDAGGTARLAGAGGAAWSPDVGAVAAATAVALYDDRVLLGRLESLVKASAKTRRDSRRREESPPEGGQSPVEKDGAGKNEKGEEESKQTESLSRRRRRTGSLGAEDDEATARLLGKIQTQQFELDRLRDTNERQGKQLLQLTLQLTSLKTEAEERSLQAREKQAQEEARDKQRQEREEARAREQVEAREAELLEKHRKELDELTAAAAESFELKCHLQDLAKACNSARDRATALEEEVASLRRDLAARDAKPQELGQGSGLVSSSSNSSHSSSPSSPPSADYTSSSGEVASSERRSLTSSGKEGEKEGLALENADEGVTEATDNTGASPEENGGTPRRSAATVSVAVQVGEGAEQAPGSEERRDEAQAAALAVSGRGQAAGEEAQSAGELSGSNEGDPCLASLRNGAPGAKSGEESAAFSKGLHAKEADSQAGLAEALRSLQFELESVRAQHACEKRRQQRQMQDLKILCVKEKTKREKAEVECQRLMAEALEQQLLELHQRQQSAVEEGAFSSYVEPSFPLGGEPLALSPDATRSGEESQKDSGEQQLSGPRAEGRRAADALGATAPFREEEARGRSEEDAHAKQTRFAGADAHAATLETTLREVQDAYDRLKDEFEQLTLAQSLLQNDVARKTEIIAHLVKKYALKEDTFRGPVSSSFSSPFGWRKLAAAAAEAVAGAGSSASSLSLEEMQKAVEETLLENIRLRTDLATLAEDFERFLRAQREAEEKRSAAVASSAHASPGSSIGDGNASIRDYTATSRAEQKSRSRSSRGESPYRGSTAGLSNGLLPRSSPGNSPSEREKREELQEGSPRGVEDAHKEDGATSDPPHDARRRPSLSLCGPTEEEEEAATAADGKKEKGLLLSAASPKWRDRSLAYEAGNGMALFNGDLKEGDGSASPVSDLEAHSEVILFRADA